MKKLLLIDGNSLLFRAFYATISRMMQTKDGTYTNAIYALYTMIDKILVKNNPDYVLVAFDKGKQTFRHELFKDYKGTRKETPVELIPQFKLARDLFNAFNIKFLEYDLIEADDIIGSISKKYNDIHIDIFSSDKDLLQLISDNVSVSLIKTGQQDPEIYNENYLYNKMLIKPYQVIELKALMGDSADNIPGVFGIGEKTALKLLQEYDNVTNIYTNINQIKGKIQEKLLNGKDNCFMSKQLATIKTDVLIDINLEDLKLNININTLYEFLTKYEMKSLANKLNINNPKQDNIEYNANNVTKISKLLLKDKSIIHFLHDPFEYYHSDIYSIIIKNKDLIEVIDFNDAINDIELLEFLKSDKLKIVYDTKEIYHLLTQHNIIINNMFDIKLACAIINTNLVDYDKICIHYDLHNTYSISDIFGTNIKRKLINNDILKIYGLDIISNLDYIYNNVIDLINSDIYTKLYYDVELPLARVLYEMELSGICVSKDILNDIANKTLIKMNDLESTIFNIANEKFNLNSPTQLAIILFDKLNLKANKKRSTAVEYLEKLIPDHPIIELILMYRKYAKLYSTYAFGLLKYIQNDHKIHTIFNQCITQTGRLSSSDPNLQNISAKDKEAKEIRKAFLPSPNCILISCDYSQIELRILAALADEKELKEAFNNDVDIHTKTASQIFNVDINDVDMALRRKAKAINFGVIYGMSNFGLSNQTDVSVNEAKIFIDNYFKAYPSIKLYMDKQIEIAQETGCSKTIYNRTRYIDEIKSSNFMVKSFGKRAAMNTPIQGSAADLIKQAMVNIYKTIKSKNLKSKMILQVHDELIFDTPIEELDIMKKIIKEEMENAMNLSVYLKAELSYGNSWYDAK